MIGVLAQSTAAQTAAKQGTQSEAIRSLSGKMKSAIQRLFTASSASFMLSTFSLSLLPTTRPRTSFSIFFVPLAFSATVRNLRLREHRETTFVSFVLQNIFANRAFTTISFLRGYTAGGKGHRENKLTVSHLVTNSVLRNFVRRSVSDRGNRGQGCLLP